jgi:uncharacterized protein (DUF1499 family)
MLIFSIIAGLLLVVVGGLLVASRTAGRPTDLGVTEGRFAELPDSPNCVSTQTQLQTHWMEPILFSGSVQAANARLKTICLATPGTSLVTDNGDYLHFEFRSRLFGFVDDVEFLIEDESGRIHFRSASRVGHSDFGVNRKRMERIRQQFQQTDG